MDLKITKTENLAEVYRKITDIGSNEVTLNIEAGSVLFERISNLRILSKMTSGEGINIIMRTEDLLGKKMISEVFYENSGEVDFSRYEDSLEVKESLNKNLEKNSYRGEKVGGFFRGLILKQNKGELSQEYEDKEVRGAGVGKEDTERNREDFGGTPKSSLFPKFPFFGSKPDFDNNMVAVVSASLGVLIVFLAGFYFYLQTSLSADLEIFVTSERFVKSQNIRLATTQNTDIANKVLRGDSYKGSITITKEIPTTGEIKSGVKSKGVVKVVNLSDEGVKIKKGEQLRYKKGDKEYLYQTLDDIQIPARKLESTSPDVYVNLSEEVSVEALDFGSNYNVEKGQGIRFVNFDSKILSSEVSQIITGGMKEDLKAVSEADIKKVYQDAIEEIKSSFIPQPIEGKVFLKGSEQFSVQKTEYSHKINEESDTLKLTLTADALGLMYDKKEIENFMRSTFKDLIPAGFEIYGKELEVEANLLGKSSSSILTTTEGDLMVTVKTYVIPILNTDSIKSKIAGKDLPTVQSELEKIPNIVNYNLNLSINIPFISKMPADYNKLNVSIVRK